ncbi:hypothetical protein [Heyndrickxia sporothermodurans]|uniref:hypothetical protein n=1 Tax=Heyndrickxia sporothermodurans TaxID=46224 RepID=UPI000D33965E|nr:hypothetical protein [Heyndrickxia sporothermodurans]PTY92931.1 hypothetical protein B5V90_02300 [Heyndrickxia sporothermodurans]
MTAGVKTCSVEGCHGKHIARGLCWKHYKRLKRNGDISDPDYANKGKSCSVDGCTDDAKRGGMCIKHYQRFYKYGDPHTLKDPEDYEERLPYDKEQCIMPGCKERVDAKELCYKHYHNYQHHLRSGNIDDIFDYLRLRDDNPI